MRRKEDNTFEQRVRALMGFAGGKYYFASDADHALAIRNNRCHHSYARRVCSLIEKNMPIALTSDDKLIRTLATQLMKEDK